MAKLSSILTSGSISSGITVIKNNVVGIKDTDTPIFDGVSLSKFYNLSGTTSGFRDLHGQITIFTQGTNDPSYTTFLGNMKGWEFSASVMNQIFLEYHPDHDYDTSAGFYPHFHFSTTSTQTGVVRFGFEFMPAKGYSQSTDSVFSASTTTVYLDYSIATNRQYEHIIAEYQTPLLFSKVETDSLILCRMFRDATNTADTFPNTIHIFRCDLHYQVNRYCTKNKNFPFNI